MKKTQVKYFLILLLICLTKTVFGNSSLKKQNNLFNKIEILKILEKVGKYQLNNMPEESWLESAGKFVEIESNGWIRSAFLTGVMAAYDVTRNKEFISFAKEWGEKNDWQLAPRIRHADDQCCIQTYAELYEIYEEPEMIKPSIEVFDMIAEDPKRGPVVGWEKDLNWSWCDALYMAPPALARLSAVTGEEKYVELMDIMYNDTYEYLYSKEHDLFYRDAAFKPDAEPLVLSDNGSPVFWSRGNGWVLAGLVRILQYLPENHDSRNWYIDLYKEMSLKIAELQNDDGFWRSNLLDPDSTPAPEASGTGFFCYALAWGINNGILERENYIPVVKKAWEGLNKCVDEKGMLHWVQLVGYKPGQVKYEDTAEYGVGAFLLAGSEVCKLFNNESE